MSHPLCQTRGMQWNERTLGSGEQLELTLGETPGSLPPAHRRPSPERATWWFAHIHARLRNAWRPVPPARPVQGGLRLSPALAHPESR
jgi:hypothetical protein